MAFRLTPAQIARARRERLDGWGANLEADAAIPVLLLGLTADGTDRLTLNVCEDVDDGTMLEMLAVAAAMLRGRAN